MRCRHGKTGCQQGADPRLFENGGNRSLYLMYRKMGRLGNNESIDDQPGRQHKVGPQQRLQAEMIEKRANTKDGQDKADRTPNANPAITTRIFTQMIKSQGLDQRQRRHPKKRENRQNTKNRAEAADNKEKGKRPQRHDTG